MNDPHLIWRIAAIVTGLTPWVWIFVESENVAVLLSSFILSPVIAGVLAKRLARKWFVWGPTGLILPGSPVVLAFLRALNSPQSKSLRTESRIPLYLSIPSTSARFFCVIPPRVLTPFCAACASSGVDGRKVAR